MADQMSLFDFDSTAGTGAHGNVRPASNGTVTSDQAAEAIRPHLNDLQARVLAFLRERGDDGATDDEMQRALGMNPSTQRPRRIELQSRGLVVDSGRTRPTASGRAACVWRAVARAEN